MSGTVELPPASLASWAPYPVPEGARLVFSFTRNTTDGFQRGQVSVVFPNGRPSQVIACNLPALGGTRQAKIVGDWSKIFPEPLPVVKLAGS